MKETKQATAPQIQPTCESNAFNEDNMIGMARYPDKFFDLAMVDPEYGIGADNPSKKPNTVIQENGSILFVKQANYNHKRWDAKPARRDYFKELMRISKNQIIWGANYYDYPLPGGRIIWDKLNGTSDQMGCEIAYNSLNKRTDIVYYLWAGMMQGEQASRDIRRALRQIGNKKMNEKRIHPTQKPIILYRWLLSNYAKPGDKILDTHMGSQSSRIAAHQMGFDYWGWELDPEYFAAGNKRFKEQTMQMQLFT